MKYIKRFVHCLIVLIMSLLLISLVNHKIQLSKEEALLTPMGKIVDVNGSKMHIYQEGQGERTLVFLSGGGTSSPVLDFKSLYSLLSDEYRIVVIEKFGYGFSDVVDKERSIDSILEDSRMALSKAGIEGPYVLCPHSMSGIEALYWAQKYPEEVEAIIGLDMAVPKVYEDYSINMPLMKVGQFAASVGLTRFIPGVAESDAIKYGTLSDHEKDIYRAIFYRRTSTLTMLEEVKNVKENAKKMEDFVPDCEMLLFVSNGQGSGWEAEVWKKAQQDFISDKEDASLISLDCPHYVHDYEYRYIAEKIKVFLEK
ncbi:MAG: alpha/beta hydrolase [Bacillota bacterium]|nr:alpha/beta hydrolase [Bacillota bacterium]